MASDLPEWMRRIRSDVGDRMRSARRARGLTQEQLAEAIGCDSKTISRAENGRHAVTIDFAARVAHALDVPFGSLFRDDEVTGGS